MCKITIKFSVKTKAKITAWWTESPASPVTSNLPSGYLKILYALNSQLVKQKQDGFNSQIVIQKINVTSDSSIFHAIKDCNNTCHATKISMNYPSLWTDIYTK